MIQRRKELSSWAWLWCGAAEAGTAMAGPAERKTASQSSALMGGGSGAAEEEWDDEVGGLGLRLYSTDVGSGGDLLLLLLPRRRLAAAPPSRS